MNIQKIQVNKLIPATYNPRKDLKPNDEEYIKIKNSIENFGFVSPLVINKDMTVIGGHQRLKVLIELGYTEIECIVVDLDKTSEKALNIALNKIQGDWDEEKLESLLKELKTENFDYLNKELLDSFELKVGAVTPISSEKGKVIDNFHCYIATCMNTEKSHDAKVGDKVSLRFSSSKEINAEIVKIIKNDTSDDEDIIIVFEIFDSVEDLIEYRKISMDIIWWKYAGLKISNSAIIEENDKTYVERNRAGYQEKIEVFIMRQNDTYSIIAYTDEHFEKLGFSKEEMSNIKRISLYDEVILH